MEIFKIIKEYPNYSVSNEGRVRKNSTMKILRPTKKPNGYLQINLFTNDGRRKKEYAHRLVALTFIQNEKCYPEVNHIDGVRDNNVVSNLEWVSRKENVQKSSVNKPIRVCKVNGEVVGDYINIQTACDTLKLTGSNVSSCLHNGRQKTHKGYIFKFI